MPAAHILIQSPRTALLWSIARRSAFLAVPLLLVWLVLQPAIALKALWYVVIPILPATFFLSTAFWRGVCPLATLSELGNGFGRQRTPPPGLLLALSIGGLALFHLMVPARHFLFNQNGPVLAGTVVAVGGLSLLLGALFPVRSAFCNALCPVLPVELLYGQAPLIPIERGRCSTCTVCTPRGCLDLADRKAIPQLLGPSRNSARWLVTPHGMFFTALPGFIIGYNQVKDGPLSTAARVYETTLGCSLASVLVVTGVILALRLNSRLAMPLLAALAGAIYYWYAGPAVAGQLGAAAWLGSAVRVGGIAVVGGWLVSAISHQPTAVSRLPSAHGQ